MDPDEGAIESTRGRILVLGGSGPHQFNLVAALDVPGCVYSVVAYQGLLVATVNHSVSDNGSGSYFAV